jgi:hypothetical protein
MEQIEDTSLEVELAEILEEQHDHGHEHQVIDEHIVATQGLANNLKERMYGSYIKYGDFMQSQAEISAKCCGGVCPNCAGLGIASMIMTIAVGKFKSVFRGKFRSIDQN